MAGNYETDCMKDLLNIAVPINPFICLVYPRSHQPLQPIKEYKLEHKIKPYTNVHKFLAKMPF